MANPTVAQAAIDRAIQQLAHAQGVLMCAAKVLDEHAGAARWEVVQAMQCAIEVVGDSYCTLNDSRVIAGGAE